MDHLGRILSHQIVQVLQPPIRGEFMRQDAFRARAAAVRWLRAAFFATILMGLFFESSHTFGGSFFISSAANADDGDWAYANYDINGTRYSPLNQITPPNVNLLAKDC